MDLWRIISAHEGAFQLIFLISLTEWRKLMKLPTSLWEVWFQEASVGERRGGGGKGRVRMQKYGTGRRVLKPVSRPYAWTPSTKVSSAAGMEDVSVPGTQCRSETPNINSSNVAVKGYSARRWINISANYGIKFFFGEFTVLFRIICSRLKYIRRVDSWFLNGVSS